MDKNHNAGVLFPRESCEQLLNDLKRREPLPHKLIVSDDSTEGLIGKIGDWTNGFGYFQRYNFYCRIERSFSGGLKYLLNFGLQIDEIKGFFNIVADSFKLEQGSHGRPDPCKNNHGRLPDPGLESNIIMTVGTQPAKECQAVFSLGDTNVHKHNIGFGRFNFPKSFNAFIRGQNLVSKRFKSGLNNLANVIFIVYHKNTF
jgi:hypothetical protein